VIDLDEELVRAQLRRRAGSGLGVADVDRLASRIQQAIQVDGNVEQRRVMQVAPLWDGGVSRLRLLGGALAGVMVLAAIGLIAFAPGPLFGPAATPSGPPATSTHQVLTAEDLVRRVQSAGPGDAGALVIVNADFQSAPFRCPVSPGACPIGYVVGTGQQVEVWPDSSPYPPGGSPDVPATVRGPLALRLRSAGGVELIGGLTLPDSGLVTWSVRAVAADVARLRATASVPDANALAVAGLYLVDGWLGGSLAPPCPLNPIAPPAAMADFSCGKAGWLTDQPVADPAQAGQSDPGSSMRVQNDAYDLFAPDPGADMVASGARRAWYLVRPLLAWPQGSCWLCQANSVGYLLGRIQGSGAVQASP
jgi:hypothetical protein